MFNPLIFLSRSVPSNAYHVNFRESNLSEHLFGGALLLIDANGHGGALLFTPRLPWTSRSTDHSEASSKPDHSEAPKRPGETGSWVRPQLGATSGGRWRHVLHVRQAGQEGEEGGKEGGGGEARRVSRSSDLLLKKEHVSFLQTKWATEPTSVARTRVCPGKQGAIFLGDLDGCPGFQGVSNMGRLGTQANFNRLTSKKQRRTYHIPISKMVGEV